MDDRIWDMHYLLSRDWTYTTHGWLDPVCEADPLEYNPINLQEALKIQKERDSSGNEV